MMKFSKLEIGQRFKYGGTYYVKKSSRTASVLKYDGASKEASSIWFYFSMKDEVEVIA